MATTTPPAVDDVATAAAELDRLVTEETRCHQEAGALRASVANGVHLEPADLTAADAAAEMSTIRRTAASQALADAREAWAIAEGERLLAECWSTVDPAVALVHEKFAALERAIAELEDAAEQSRQVIAYQVGSITDTVRTGTPGYESSQAGVHVHGRLLRTINKDLSASVGGAIARLIRPGAPPVAEELARMGRYGNRLRPQPQKDAA